MMFFPKQDWQSKFDYRQVKRFVVSVQVALSRDSIGSYHGCKCNKVIHHDSSICQCKTSTWYNDGKITWRVRMSVREIVRFFSITKRLMQNELVTEASFTWSNTIGEDMYSDVLCNLILWIGKFHTRGVSLVMLANIIMGSSITNLKQKEVFFSMDMNGMLQLDIC
jgi:hypothetical protein